MRAAMYNGPRDITVGERPDPRIEHPAFRTARVPGALDAPVAVARLPAVPLGVPAPLAAGGRAIPTRNNEAA